MSSKKLLALPVFYRCVLILTSSCTVHGFENARYYVREEEEALGQDRLDTTFKPNVKGTTNFGSLSLIGHITSEAGPDTSQSLLHVQKDCIDFEKILRDCT